AKPVNLPGALVAWVGPFEGVEDHKAVLYSMQAANPRPEVEIASLEFALPVDEQGKPRGDRAIPVLLAVTLGTIIK
ncbi:MAG: hypothetical protein ACUVX8_09075, partial [Candidatus Zipacnadales bacterium]